MQRFLWQQTTSMATRDFSRNPSKALRDAVQHPVLVTRYGQPIACLVPIDYWKSIVDMLRSADLSERLERCDEP
ncbi:type II toxin-antitoxin system Phd/YefM family antitoxin [Burkholderia sp. FERM BP-3421]|uniref:type II toxin-antitoxin system prevent-host-death family antitoxin n=1 Tax=Burkholderia sp. FERM BP-3421 TaxID=1494466 RepID=UPI00235F1142|nr:type II toxin-antitoxin system prevent-host-death family antitoxin [Burkholderia sp. FERM BP-3421]WDD91357.1 type II toxin-antitoxin system Phd/YefM family antitoxin [Burkholderia sp. FERM BP-3421]